MAQSNDANSRIAEYWERGALYLIGVVLMFGVYSFQEQTKRLENLEAKVIYLDKSKVDKADLKEVEDRINTKIDGMKTAINDRQDIMQSSILARMDFYFKSRQ